MIYRLGDRGPTLDDDGHFIAPNASVIGDVRLMAGASVWFAATLRGDNDRIVIGRNSNIQDGSVLHTDPGVELIVGDQVTVGHRVTLHGCRIGDNSLIGIGATVLNHARIGDNSLVGAQSLITEGKTFPDGVLILGSPARVVRELEPDEIEMLKGAAAIYVEQSRRYRADLATADHAGA